MNSRYCNLSNCNCNVLQTFTTHFMLLNVFHYGLKKSQPH